MKRYIKFLPLVLAVVLVVTCAFLIGKSIAEIGNNQTDGYYPYPVYPWMYWADTPIPDETEPTQALHRPLPPIIKLTPIEWQP